MFKQNKKNKALILNTERSASVQGFTLIELLVTVTVIALISSFSLAYYRDFNTQSELEQEANKIYDTLNLAKKKAEASDIELGQGQTCDEFGGYQVDINVSNSTYTMLLNCTTIAYNIHQYVISAPAKITSSNQSIIFKPLSQGTNLPSTITIKLDRTPTINKCFGITVNPQGVITKVTVAC